MNEHLSRRRFLLASAVPAAGRIALPGAAAILAAGFTTPARAQFKIDVSGIGATQIPVGIAHFAGQDTCGQAIADIVRADLVRSGQFRAGNLGGVTLTEQGPPNFAAWSSASLEAAVGGHVQSLGPGRWQVAFRLWDAVKQADLGGESYKVVTGDLRLAAHRIADFIYQKLTGQRGVFATRIAYITKRGWHSYQLVVADSDGVNARAALRSRQPLLSPTWSPDGGSLAYVSFESGKPVVYIQTIRTGTRRAVANFKGSNSAPAFSPDGRTLAVVLTLTSRSQVYMMPAGGGHPRQVTNAGTISTEPVFTPDGSAFFFVSDRDGSAQIYRANTDGSNIQRITFQGNYNVSPAISPDGKNMAYIAQVNGNFQLWLQDLTSGNTRALGDGPNDGRPTFAPNGQIILYSGTERGVEVLRTVSIDGSVRTTLATSGQSVLEPAWGPWTPGA